MTFLKNSNGSIGYYAFRACDSLANVYYSGTKQEWNQINIDPANDDLYAATVWCSDGAIINPLELKSVSTSVNTAENTVEIRATVGSYWLEGALERSNLYVAEYDAQGRLLKVTQGTKSKAEEQTVTFKAAIPASEKYKIMLWDGNNVPIMDAIDDIAAIQ